MSAEPILAVNEIFGITFQGEGPNIGMPVLFLRLAGCNQACTWCDTPYAWDWKRVDIREESHTMPVSLVLKTILKMSQGVKNLVISGGEPMLQQKALTPLVSALLNYGWHIEIETAGSIVPLPALQGVAFNVSPKLKHSGNPRAVSIVPAALRAFAKWPKVAFKFVVSRQDDFDELDDLVADFNLSPVYIMPEGRSLDELSGHIEQIAEAAIERRYYLTTRLQVLIYGNKRAV